MLIKDPAERIKLREVKRHPWVVRDINNVIGWLEASDPLRRTAGRRIQVDDRELERTVTPITLLELLARQSRRLSGRLWVSRVWQGSCLALPFFPRDQVPAGLRVLRPGHGGLVPS